jgi:hypothetical protein
MVLLPGLLELDGRDVSDGFEQSRSVPPVDPAEGGLASTYATTSSVGGRAPPRSKPRPTSRSHWPGAAPGSPAPTRPCVPGQPGHAPSMPLLHVRLDDAATQRLALKAQLRAHRRVPAITQPASFTPTPSPNGPPAPSTHPDTPSVVPWNSILPTRNGASADPGAVHGVHTAFLLPSDGPSRSVALGPNGRLSATCQASRGRAASTIRRWAHFSAVGAVVEVGGEGGVSASSDFPL